jgi:hypothetical protein
MQSASRLVGLRTNGPTAIPPLITPLFAPITLLASSSAC